MSSIKKPILESENTPIQTAFSQQRIEAWRPLFTPTIVFTLSVIVGSLFLGVGLYFMNMTDSMYEEEIRYDDVCSENSTCIVNFSVTNEVSNVYMFYKLTNFYQNHRRYVFSRNYEQLRGEYVDFDDMENCDPYRSINGSTEPKNWILPCGAVANSYFNDSYEILKESGEPVPTTYSGIAWRSDLEKLFKNLSSEYKTGYRWMNLSNIEGEQRNEHFIVWMRTSSLPTFIKLFARNIKLDPGNYSLVINNQYPKHAFGGEKSVILSTLTIFGGKNTLIYMSYIVVGSSFLVFSFFVLMIRICCPRELGDANYVKFND